jgi:IS5 family transposase
LRIKQDSQGVLEFQGSWLAETVRHHARYVGIDEILKKNPRIVDLVHRDLAKALQSENRKRNRKCKYTSDNVLRILLCKAIEAESYRMITVRIDDSEFFRRFTRIHDKPMMGFAALNTVANQITPETWKKVNEVLARHAVKDELIEGEKLRLDTTAVETNIHYPSDSSLLWDVYRVLGRSIEKARELDPTVVGDRRLQTKRVKKLSTKITRMAGRKNKKLRTPYKALIGLVETILAWSQDVAAKLEKRQDRYGPVDYFIVLSLIAQLRHFAELGARVVDQAQRRVLKGEQVPNDEKLFSIFEPHTELLKRGKAGKPIEFGHMVLLQQVDGKFITDYHVFDKKPVEHALVDAAIKSHTKLFDSPPAILATDKGFYENMDRIAELEEDIELVSIAKKGPRTEEETERETNVLFKMAQMFRAGIEGSISFLKRCLRLSRCFNKGLTNYHATVGLTVFAHNLIVLARDTG